MSNVFTNDRTANSPAAATPSRLANLKNQLGAVDDLIISSVLKSTATGSVAGEARRFAGSSNSSLRHAANVADYLVFPGSKEPLSLQQTSNNFKKFVQKSGPIFVAQDAAEAVLRWEDGSQTIFFAVVWGFICAVMFCSGSLGPSSDHDRISSRLVPVPAFARSKRLLGRRLAFYAPVQVTVELRRTAAAGYSAPCAASRRLNRVSGLSFSRATLR